MDADAHIDHLRTDSAALVAAYRADPHAPTSTLAWDRAELLHHVANVHGWVRAQLHLGTGERVRFSEVEPAPEGPDLPEWFEAGAVELVDLLAAMDLGATWPTWAGPQPGTFFPRRMAQETAVHRWDAAGGDIDAALAVDGVTELLELFVPRLPAERLADAHGSIHLHATDTEGEWTGAPESRRDHLRPGSRQGRRGPSGQGGRPAALVVEPRPGRRALRGVRRRGRARGVADRGVVLGERITERAARAGRA